jgi:hypothetical protein
MPRPKKPPDFNRSAVKCCLAKYLLQPALIPEINRWVTYISKLYHRASYFFNLHLLRLIEQGSDFPDFSDEVFFYQCLTIGMNKAKKPNQELITSWNIYHHLFPLLPRIDGDKQAILYLSRKYQANFLNHIRVPFFSRQFKMILLLSPKKKIARRVQLMINNRISLDSRLMAQFSPEIQAWVQAQRDWFQQVEVGAKVDMAWIRKHFNRAITYTYYMQGVFKQAEAVNFSIAPQAQIKSHFLVIDTKILYHMSKNVGLHRENESTFRSNKDDYWHEYFDLESLRDVSYFADYIETDGVALCVHYELPKSQISPQGDQLTQRSSFSTSNQTVNSQPPVSEDQRCIAFDPNRENILYGVERLPNGEMQTYILSRGRYYEEGHINRSHRRTHKCEQAIQPINDQLSQTTAKTPSIDQLIEYVQIQNQHREQLWAHRTQKKYARNRMDVYIHKNKCLDRFFSSLWQGNQSPPIIAYGNAKFASTGPGEKAVPTTGVAKKCQQYYKTVGIDEHLTTKMCHECGEKLTVLYHDEHKEIKMTKGSSGKKIRGLRWCGSTSCLKLWNRDQNAALNILGIARSVERPKYLSRKRVPEGNTELENLRTNRNRVS